LLLMKDALAFSMRIFISEQ